MKKKIKIFFSLFLVLVLLLGALAYYDVKGGPNVRIFEKLGINFKVPIKIRTFLKEKIFYLPELQNKNKLQRAQIEELKGIRKHAVELWYMMGDVGFQKINAYFLNNKNISTEHNDYQIKLFSLPFHNHGKTEAAILYAKLLKPVAYLEQTNDHVILATGNGIFFYFEKERVKDLVANQNSALEYNNLELKTIKTNIRDLIVNKKFYYEGYPGIRDLMILNNKIYVSYNNTPTHECYNTTIMVSDLNLTNLNFSKFFTYDECVSKENKKFQSNGAPATWSGGGKMFTYKDGKILFYYR